MPLKALLIDSNSERAGDLREKLASCGIDEIHHLPGDVSFAEDVRRLSPDVIIVALTLPDRHALDEIRKISAAAPKPIILFAGQDDASFAKEAIAAGVSSYNITGISPPDIKPILTAAIALFERYRKVEEELERAKALVAERRIIEKAKAILMSDGAMSEPDAYRFLRKKAMSESKKIVRVAADVIEKHAARARKA